VLYLLNNINHYTIGIRQKEINIGQYIYIYIYVKRGS